MASTAVGTTPVMTSDHADVTSKPAATVVKLSGTGKTIRKSRFALISSLSGFAIVIFVADILLLGRTGEARETWSGLAREVSSILSIRTTKFGAIDCFCSVFLLSCIGLKLLHGHRSTRLTSHGSTTHSPDRKIGSQRTQRGSGRREEPRPRASSGGAAAGSESAPSRTSSAHAQRAAESAKWNQAIDLAARQGDSTRAGSILMEFESHGAGEACARPDAVSYNLVIRACARRGDYQGAEKWLRRMEKSGIEATLCSYNTLLDACAKANNAEACEDWLTTMISKGVEANVISYATVIYARARRGEEARAEAWLKKMIHAGIEPDAVSYNSMIHACGVNGNPQGAEHWVDEMLLRGLEATVTTFTAVIDSCAKAGDVPRAETMLEKMIASKVQPNVVSFSAMIDACAKACDLPRAEYWHNRMTVCGIKPNAHSFSAVINACAKAGDVAKAEEWLGQSEKDGIATDVVVYSSVIDACGKVGDADRAAVIFQRMQDHGIRPHIVAYAALARPYAYRGDWTEVERIVEEMATRDIYPNEYFLYAQLLSYATARPRQAQRAEECFRQSNKAGVKANDHVVGALVRAVGRDRCIELMNELCNGRPVPVPVARRDGGSNGSRVKPLPRRH